MSVLPASSVSPTSSLSLVSNSLPNPLEHRTPEISRAVWALLLTLCRRDRFTLKDTWHVLFTQVILFPCEKCRNHLEVNLLICQKILQRLRPCRSDNASQRALQDRFVFASRSPNPACLSTKEKKKLHRDSQTLDEPTSMDSPHTLWDHLHPPKLQRAMNLRLAILLFHDSNPNHPPLLYSGDKDIDQILSGFLYGLSLPDEEGKESSISETERTALDGSANHGADDATDQCLLWKPEVSSLVKLSQLVFPLYDVDPWLKPNEGADTAAFPFSKDTMQYFCFSQDLGPLHYTTPLSFSMLMKRIIETETRMSFGRHTSLHPERAKTSVKVLFRMIDLLHHGGNS